MRLGRIRFSAIKAVINASQWSQYFPFYSKTRVKNYHHAGREFETSALEEAKHGLSQGGWILIIPFYFFLA